MILHAEVAPFVAGGADVERIAQLAGGVQPARIGLTLVDGLALQRLAGLGAGGAVVVAVEVDDRLRTLPSLW